LVYKTIPEKTVKILALYLNMPSTVCLYVDGRIEFATHEERYSRKKNDNKYPEYAIQSALKTTGLSKDDLDAVVIASHVSSVTQLLTKQFNWTVGDYLQEQHKIWKPLLVDGREQVSTELELFSDYIDESVYPNSVLTSYIAMKDCDLSFSKDRQKIIAQCLDMDVSRVGVIEHHRAHAAYSYYASHFRGEKILSFTIDGWGDGKNATIGVFDEKGSYQEHYSTDQCAIGRIYRYMTLLLGMKPNEHEFKVMGLAPYGKKKYAQQALDLFKSTLYVDGTEFKWKTKPTDSYFWFKERLEGVRFDNIAYALQTWVEDLLIEWVSNAIEKYNIHKIVISGGVAMNIKAMGEIAALDCVEDIFIGGSASDESLAIGSAICMAEDLTKKNDQEWDSSTVSSLPHLYLGPDTSIEDEEAVVAHAIADSTQSIIENPTNEKIADLLSNGNVVARCAGRMEFGQRALGNRSILADPSDLRVKDKINTMIKSRDFWMPFAPIVLDSYVDRYLVNPKKLSSPHMTIGFDTTSEGFDAMIAACHPADKTARPQILKRDSNPDVYDLIRAFEEKTGRGAILNTSFNLHGYPIVNTPQEAYDVFNRSGLDGLLLKNYLILKNDAERV
jgi:carbamoyltransferase